jgi:hypothetical protein
MLRHMEWTGYALRSLTITLNELCPKAKATLEHEINMRTRSMPGGQFLLTDNELMARRNKWEDDEEEGAAQWIDEPYAFSNTENVQTFRGLLVENLYIDGTSTTNDYDHIILRNGKLRVTNKMAKLVQKWLSKTGVQALEIKFIGKLGGTPEMANIVIEPSQDGDTANWDTYTPEAFWHFL